MATATDSQQTTELGHSVSGSWYTVTARAGGIILGSLDLDLTDEGAWQVVAINVDSRHRRRGIASAMNAYAVAEITGGAPIHHAGDSMSPEAKGLFSHLRASAPAAHRYSFAG